jgi:hypothetical protein
MMSLPLFDTMTHHEVDQVAECLRAVIDAQQEGRWRKPSRSEQPVPLVYGGMSRATGEIAVE